MGHDHKHTVTDNKKFKLIIVLTFTFGFMLVEIIVGIMSNSLALLSDAGHMANDVFSLALALFAVKIGEKTKNVDYTYGYKRVEIVAAFINGLTLFLIVGYILMEAIKRTLELNKIEIKGGIMLIASVVGLIVNLVGIFILSRGEKNVNISAALHHVLADLLGSVAAVITGVGILLFKWYWLDIVTSVFISLLILKSAIEVTRQSLNVLIESSPEGIDTASLLFEIHDMAGVLEIHDFHAWKLDDETNLLTAHILIDEELDVDQFRQLLEDISSKYGFNHTTFQIERINCRDENGNCVMNEEGYIRT